MNNEINELLRNLDARMDRQETMMQQLISMVGHNTDRMNVMNKQLERIEESMNRIEHSQPSDILAMLKQINGKLDERDNEIQVLNKRLFKTESEIERLTKQ